MLTSEPNLLVYYLRDCTTGNLVSARFSPLVDTDATEIGGESWQGIFAPIWKQIIEAEALRKQTCKLMLEGGSDTRIQGLLFFGMASGIDWSLDCLLEAAPWNQQDRSDRLYCGVGRALVARVIKAHWQRGLHTPLRIEASPRSVPFYQRLGFILPKATPKANRLILLDDAARTILESVTSPQN